VFIQTSLFPYSFTGVSNYALSFLFRVSSARLATNSFTWEGRCDMLLFYWLVSLPGLSADSFTWKGRCDMLLIDVLESAPTLPAYPFTRVNRVHVVCCRKRMTRQSKAQHDTTTHYPAHFKNRDHSGLLIKKLITPARHVHCGSRTRDLH
jgi:hypothetical protein